MLLTVDNVSKSFGGLQVLTGLSFTVAEGQVVGLIGPNGAGKTTAFNLISGVHSPTAGAIRYQDRSLLGLQPYQICRQGIARTFQITRPFNRLTVLESVTVGALHHTDSAVKSREIAADLLRQVGMYDLKDRLGRDLTVVQRKRLEVARALATQPKLLLLDEVAAGLPPAELPVIIELVRQVQARGVAVLMVEHVLPAVMTLADNIVVLSYGKCIATGKPAEVVKNPAVVEAYLGEEYALA